MPLSTEQARANAAKRKNPGRKSLALEISYLEAVKVGAPPEQVTKAVRAVLKRATEKGDARALSAVLTYLVPALVKSEQQLSGDPTKPIVIFGRDIPDALLRAIGGSGTAGDSTPTPD